MKNRKLKIDGATPRRRKTQGNAPHVDNSHWSKNKYQAYEDSGVEWSGEIPHHWSITRIKSKGSVRGRVGWKALKADEYVDNGYVFLSTPNIKEKDIDFNNVNYITYERYIESPEIILEKNDILLAKDGSTLGIVNIVSCLPREATVNSSIAVIRFNKEIFNKYLYYQILSEFIQSKINLKKSGMGVPHLFQRDINNFIIVLPPLSEQRQIAHYLDRKTAQIDRKIDLLTQKANKYEELKKSLINETVTRGLNKSVAMKDSGIEWIGEIPKHWEVRRIKDILLPNHLGIKIGPFGSSLKLEMMKNEGYKIYGQEHVINNDFKIGHKYIDVNKFKELQNYEIVSGDIVITMMGTVGKSKVVPEGIEKGIMDSHLIRIRVIKSVLSYLLSLSINESKYILDQRKSFSKGSIMEGLNSRIIKCLKVVVPPLSEQKQIALYLDEKTAHCDKIIITINQQIDKLKELRKTLINDVVTGKIRIIKN